MSPTQSGEDADGRTGPETITCATCHATCQTVHEDHDGGTLWILPDDWGYRETDEIDDFRPYCSKCQPAAIAKERALYFGSETT